MQLPIFKVYHGHAIFAAFRANPMIGTSPSTAPARLPSRPGWPAHRRRIDDPIAWIVDGGIDRRRGSSNRSDAACAEI
jgi:hypothetical protein